MGCSQNGGPLDGSRGPRYFVLVDNFGESLKRLLDCRTGLAAAGGLVCFGGLRFERV